MKVLVVDDSALMRTLVKNALVQEGGLSDLEIVEAANGEQALTALTVQGVDLVLLDWNMPVLDGLGFVKRVRSDGSDVPIIMITAVSDEEAITEACAAGVTDYVEKPIRGHELWQRLQGYCS